MGGIDRMSPHRSPCPSPAAAMELLGDATRPLPATGLIPIARQAATLAGTLPADPLAPPLMVPVRAGPLPYAASPHRVPGGPRNPGPVPHGAGFLLRELAAIDGAAATQWARVADVLRHPEQVPREELTRHLCRALDAHKERGAALASETLRGVKGDAWARVEDERRRFDFAAEAAAARRRGRDPRVGAAAALATATGRFAPMPPPLGMGMAGMERARRGEPERPSPLLERRAGELPSGRRELAPVPDGVFGRLL